MLISIKVWTVKVRSTGNVTNRLTSVDIVSTSATMSRDIGRCPTTQVMNTQMGGFAGPMNMFSKLLCVGSGAFHKGLKCIRDKCWYVTDCFGIIPVSVLVCC